MENKIKIQKRRRIMLVGGSILSLIVLGIIINGSFLNFELAMLDFAAHHYFLVSFAIILITLLFVRSYLLKHGKENHPATIKKLSKLIEHSKIKTLRFKETDVLNDSTDLEVRQKQILLSVRLGFLLRKKVVIFFKDENAKFHIKTEEIKKDEDTILLKGNIKLPIKSIYRIELPQD